jgi:acetoacetyl-CoA reductase
MTTATAVKTAHMDTASPQSASPVGQRIAFVSGGMGGIGTAVCRRLGRSGVKVVAGCLPGYEKKDSWLATMRSEGLQVYAAEGDVDDYESCADMFYQVGSVDILVNNAGITRDGVLKRMPSADWYAVINTNLNSVFNVTRQVIEGMTERGWGRIINISSVNALKGQQEVVKRGVTVNTVSPGYVETDMVRAMKPEILQSIVGQIPMGRLAQPEEIASLVAYLASDEAGYVTGANISINGGLHMV